MKLAPLPPPDVHVALVHLLYTAFPQVAALAVGVTIGAGLVTWRTGEPAAVALFVAAIAASVARLVLLGAFRVRSARGPLTSRDALWWERAYAVGAVTLSCVIGALTWRAFAGGLVGDEVLFTGLTLAAAGGQSSTRTACRPWVPIASGLTMMAALALACLARGGETFTLIAGLLALYAASYVEACRHGGRTMLARLLAEREATRLAAQDALTGLPNRGTLRARVRDACARADRDGRPFAVLCLDLDGFKGVNDTLGHAAGDDLLRQVAARLRATVRPGDVTARLGGDEFAVLTAPGTDEREAAALAARLAIALARPYALDGREVATVGASVGVAVWGLDGTDAVDLAKAADGALYDAKRAGRRTWRVAERAALAA